MSGRSLTLACATALSAVTGFAEDLPWVYDTTARPKDVVSVGTEEPAVSGLGSASGDSAALAYFNSYFNEVFQLDGLSVYVFRGMLIFVK